MIEFLIIVDAGSQRHDTEDGEGCEQIGSEVEDHRIDRPRHVDRGDHADEQIARMGNTREPHEPLNVALCNGSHVTEQDRRRSDDGEHWHEHFAQPDKGPTYKLQQHDKTSSLGSDGEISRDGRRGTLIDVRHPNLKRYCADFEADTRNDEQGTYPHNQMVRIEEDKIAQLAVIE